MTTERTLADAVAAIVKTHDVADVLATLLDACAAAYPSDAVAVLVRTPKGGLDLLSSTSHRAEELELLQIQSNAGPCVESMDEDTAVFVVGAEELARRFGDVGAAIVEAGYDEAHAFPMHWRGQPIGGLNVFVRSGGPTDRTVGQMFADLATLAVLQSNDLAADQVVARVHEAISARAVVEQAKGVLAQTLGVDLDAAFDHLLAEAEASRRTLTQAAEDLIAAQYRD